MIVELLAAASLAGAAQATPGDEMKLGVRTERKAVVRIYLVPLAARNVRSELDRRLHYVGSARPRNGVATASFRVPPLEGRFRAWCTGCGYGGRLTISLPGGCPVAAARGGPRELPGVWHGNDLLWAAVPSDGVLRARPQDVAADGSISTKLGWVSYLHGNFTLTGRRLDATSPALVVHRVNEGSWSSDGPWHGAGWATPVTFPAPGCWRLTARVTAGTTAASLSLTLKVQT